MANTTTLVGNCLAPFLDAAHFPRDGGFVAGRLCAAVHQLPAAPTCCLPCPAAQYAYSDSIDAYSAASGWLSVMGLLLLAFMLVSYVVVLPAPTTGHYLSVGLVVSVMMIMLGFTVPLAAQPDPCYDAITPNDMYTSPACACGGAFVLAGGLTATMWVLIRALSMNLQICWDVVPGPKFFYLSQLAGWGIPAILSTATMTVTGVSFRFGRACHVNHNQSMAVFWAPLLAMAGTAAMLQLATFAYCIHVYLKSLGGAGPAVSTNVSAGLLPSCPPGSPVMTARLVYRRLKKVLWLQWRGICIVSIILVDVIFFSVVFVALDGMQTSLAQDWEKVTPWLTCLALHPDDKNECLPLVQGWLVDEPTVVAVLFLLSLTGLQVFLLLTRPSFFSAWLDYFRSKVPPPHPPQDSGSAHARPDIMRSHPDARFIQYQRGHQATTFEMQSKPPSLDTADLDMTKTMTIHPLPSPHDTRHSPPARGRSPAMDPAAPACAPGRLPGDSSERRFRAPTPSFAQPHGPTRPGW